MSKQTNNTRRPWGKRRSRQGFTLAELLVVIAIITILSGVVFIAVWTYQRSMGQLERDGIAKQIFIAAQNHLTAARGEGYLGRTKFGTKGEASEDIKGNYYFVVTNGSVSEDGDEIFDLMLPFGALDETILADGSYLIRYNKDSGTVLDVFYCTTHGSPDRFNNRIDASKDYFDLLAVAGDRNKSQRRTYTKGDDCIVGWYGGAEGIEHKEPLEMPRITKHNEEILWIDVSDDNKNKEGASLRLEVTGETSGAVVVFILRKDGVNHSDERIKWEENGSTCHVVLDDITTAGRNFSAINSISSDNFHSRNGINFRPGEELFLRAIAYNNTGLALDANTGTERKPNYITNSLFADGTNTTARISNFRHFENLDRGLSGFANTNAAKSGQAIPSAEQTKDLVWLNENSSLTGSTKPEDFVSAVKYIRKENLNETNNTVNVYVGNTAETENCLHPVNLNYGLSYDGKSYQDSKVCVNSTGAAGLFGTIGDNGSSIKDLQLLDFSVAGASNTGALAGTMTNCTVTNVLAYNSSSDRTPTVTTTGGSAGGLIGSMSGGSVTKSAAALVVNGSGSAGGLIGSMSGGSVTASYAGGHTENAEYWTHNADLEREEGIYNVRAASGTAGGLIGSMSGGMVSGSYSTCSASGTMVGGFVGSGSGVNISNCYCTGLVFGNTKGAFAGSIGGTINACRYFEIINEVQDVNQGFTPLSSVGGGASNGGITAFDASAASYNEFCGAPTVWQPAHAYDGALGTNGYYGGKYNLKTINQLDSGAGTSGFAVSAHYGDWPAPEAFVFNK